MAVRRSVSPTFRIQTYYSNGNIRKDSTSYKFRVQSAPPLSLQQYARSIAVIPGTKTWQPSGVYHQPSFHDYLSPAIRKKPEVPQVKPWIYSYKRKYSLPTYTLKNYKDPKPKPSEPIWHPSGRYIDKRPTSLSPEKRWQKPIHEPIWQPAGRAHYKPIPYFDPPNLRWTLQQLLRSMPDLKRKTLYASRSTLGRKSLYI